MSSDYPVIATKDIPADSRVAIVAARYNSDITEELVLGCQRRLGEVGIIGDRLALHRVPGAFELPAAAKAIALTRRVAAVICIGCVIQGDTPHFDYVAGEAARGILQASLDTGVPIIFGVLTVLTLQQAWDRTGGTHGHAGERAADAALEMITVMRNIALG